MAGLVSRREVARVGLLALPFLFGGVGEGQASSVSRRVRLKDVENPKLQEALRAAVVGDLENAENLFSELLVEDPNSASVWSNRGSVRVSLQKFELAAEDFSKAIALAPEAPVPFLNRAISYEVPFSIHMLLFANANEDFIAPTNQLHHSNEKSMHQRMHPSRYNMQKSAEVVNVQMVSSINRLFADCSEDFNAHNLDT